MHRTLLLLTALACSDSAPDAPSDPASTTASPSSPTEAEGPPDEPTAAASLGAELAAALTQPDLAGGFVIEARQPDGTVVDTCTGDARALVRPDELVGLAQCTFAGELSDFGATVGVFRVPAGSTAGTFDASPAPVVAPVQLSTGADGTRSLAFEGTVSFEDGEGLAYAGTLSLSPVEGD